MVQKLQHCLQEGLAKHQNGDWSAAEAAYREVLRTEPNHADALYLLGSLHYQRGNAGSAALFLKRATASRPSHAEAWANLGLALLDQHKPAEAVAACRRATQLRPDLVAGWFNLGNALREAEDYDGSAAAFRRVVARSPKYAEAHDNLGLALRNLDQYDEALAACREAIRLQPNLAVAHNNLGAILKCLDRLTPAAEAFQQAVTLDPSFAEAHANLGITLAGLCRLPEALTACQTAVTLQPTSSHAWNNLGLALREAGELPGAVQAFQHAIDLKPGFADAFNNMGVCWFGQDQHDEAIRCYRTALEHKPESAVALVNLGTALETKGEIPEARTYFVRAAKLGRHGCFWRLRAASACPPIFETTAEIDAFRAELLDRLNEHRSERWRCEFPELVQADLRPSFNLPFHGRCDRTIKEAHAGIFQHCFSTDRPKHPTGKPRVGFVVTAGHEWAFLRSIGGLFNFFDRNRFDPVIVCGQAKAAQLQSAIPGPLAAWCVLSTNAAAAADAIRAGQFDLLYHWEIGTCSMNYFLPFLRLAPIQVTSWGIQVTSGNPAIDMYIGSQWIEADDADDHYTERLVRLDTLLSYQYRSDVPTTFSREEFGLAPTDHVYLCAQQVGKFHPEFDDVLRMILEQDPRGVIVITRGKNPQGSQHLQERFDRRIGPLAQRIRWAPLQVGSSYHRLIQTADVILDPLYFGGVNTSYDAFSGGKIVVTLPTALHPGRYTLGCYRRMGIMDAVAKSKEDYARLAGQFAADADRRHDLEAKIRSARDLLFERREVADELQEHLLETIERSRAGKTY